ncbi:MAG: phosphoribosylaminoimidazolesuccinocarboxamide synthase [Planctomycetota bacterium]
MTATLTRQGKVRDIYDLGDRFLMVASDRISAFDWVLPTTIPDKGRVLTQLSLFWFEFLGVPNHLLTSSLDGIALPKGLTREQLEGRSMVVLKCQVIPIECVVRGYLVGSGWKDYQRIGSVCGHQLPPDMLNCGKFREPWFTPATKAESGHDENIDFETACRQVGEEVVRELSDKSLGIYRLAADHAASRGIILADTQFEFGWHDGRIILIDEVLTPDSSRFWPADEYEPGRNQRSFDKQFVREFLESTTWDKNSPPPELPAEIVARTREKYIEAYERLSSRTFQWK